MNAKLTNNKAMNNAATPINLDRLASSEASIPPWLKLAYTGFIAVLVPVYWINYGPSNFLYFCDVALFLTLFAVWSGNPRAASMAAVGIVLPQMLWVADFTTGLVGFHITGMTSYMFDGQRSLFLRGLSLFHGWLPFLLLFLVARLGYDRRAFRDWTVLAWALMLICYFLFPAPPASPDNLGQPVNINYVFGPNDAAPQSWMPAPLWLLVMMSALPTMLYFPMHLALRKWFPEAPERRGIRR